MFQSTPLALREREPNCFSFQIPAQVPTSPFLSTHAHQQFSEKASTKPSPSLFSILRTYNNTTPVYLQVEACKKAFEAFDTNKSGEIDAWELRNNRCELRLCTRELRNTGVCLCSCARELRNTTFLICMGVVKEPGPVLPVVTGVEIYIGMAVVVLGSCKWKMGQISNLQSTDRFSALVQRHFVLP